MINDPQYLAREMIQSFEVEGLGQLKLPGIVPKFSETPGQVKWVGPKLGEHSEEIYKKIGLSDHELKQLKDKGVI
jgi:crotonobetainyl-CoA:carnitine CoA-transferase CaiB-like acyl-CoA transferase